MENASKALIIAGSILMSLLVVTALVLLYKNLSTVQQTKSEIEENNKTTNYNSSLEQFNKTLYGSELLSLANLQEDYNKTQASEKGYAKITINVKIKRQIAGSAYFLTSVNSIEDIISDKNAIEKEISRYERNSIYKGKTVKYYSQINNREIANIYGIEFSSYETDYDVGENLKRNSATNKLMENIEQYKNLKTIYTEFKNKRFKCKKIEYEKNNGRITNMQFEEI